MEDLKTLIREVPDFPKPGILFYDITTLLRDKVGLHEVIERMTAQIAPLKPDYVMGIEARGFIFAPAIAYILGVGFIPVRKPKKLPGATECITYDLEYGTDTLEVHRGAFEAGARIVIADDLLATGGTSQAAAKLVERIGGKVVGLSFVVELDFLSGRDRLQNYNVSSLIRYAV
jgi:adenine phosphoribosyltransferase